MVNKPMTTINNNKWYILYEQHERERVPFSNLV